MKKQIRCPADKTLLVTRELNADGTENMTFGREVSAFSRPGATFDTREVVVVCPKCKREVLAQVAPSAPRH